MINTSSYNDDYDASKKFTQFLAMPGRGLQTREVTQIQTLLLNMISRVSDILLKEGNVVEGCNFWFEGNTLHVGPGKVYSNGLIHLFDGGTKTLTKTGKEVVGTKLVQTIVTEVEDTSLLDPQAGYANTLRAGCHRIKSEIQLTLDDPTASELYTFVDGVVQMVEEKPELQIINEILARRTYDESGSYKTTSSGFRLWAESYDSTNIKLHIESGSAYVRGIQISNKPSSYILVPKSLAYNTVTGEPHTYDSGLNPQRYKLGNKFVKQINSVLAQVQTTQTVTKGSANGADILEHTPVASIVSVVQGATTYTAVTDYNLINNSSVDWSPGGDEPETSSSYSVTYTYMVVLNQGNDYTFPALVNNDGYIEFTGTGLTPVNGSVMYVDYEYYLSRCDRVYLDTQGAISLLPGQSSIDGTAKPPLDSDPFRLSLGTIELPPNSNTAIIDNTCVTSVSMKELHSMLRRLNTLEYNAALDDLDQQALNTQQSTPLLGILTDGFVGFSRCDLTFDRSDGDNSPFSASIDMENNELGLDTSYIVSDLSPNIALTDAKRYDNNKFYTLKFNSEEIVISQNIATGTISVNPYSAFEGNPLITLIPDSDYWINTTNIQIDDITTVTQRVRNWWRHRDIYGQNGVKITQIGTQQTVVDNIIPFARQIQVNIKGKGFPVNTDNLVGSIDGTTVVLTAVDPSLAGTNPGTVKANYLGEVDCNFTIPANTRTGSRVIKLSNNAAGASMNFWIEGIDKTVIDTTFYKRVVTTWSDPLAQSFMLSEDRYVTSIDLFFAQKDPTLGLSVQIRTMENGLPSNVILSEVNLSPSQIAISNDASVPTTINFPHPVLCEADQSYCIVIPTASSQYTAYMAQLNQLNIATGNAVNMQPYGPGVLFSSSNAITWTAHQDSDLKFILRSAVFETTSTVTFNVVDDEDVDGVVLITDLETPKGTACNWQCQLSEGGEWQPLTALDTKLLSALSDHVTVRAILSTSNPKMSPVIKGDACKLIGMHTQTAGVYVTKEVSLLQAYTTVTQTVELYAPTGATVAVKFSYDDADTWITGTLVSTQQLPDGFSALTYEYTTVPNSLSFRARVDLATNSPLTKPIVRQIINVLK